MELRASWQLSRYFSKLLLLLLLLFQVDGALGRYFLKNYTYIYIIRPGVGDMTVWSLYSKRNSWKNLAADYFALEK